MYQTTLKIDGMMCGMCESHINDTIRKAAPVKKVTSSHAKGEAVVLTDEPLDIEAVKATRSRTRPASPTKKRRSPFSRSDSLFLLSWKTALSPCRQSGFS